MDRGITVLSLFDGMSCGQLALGRAEVKVNRYLASEIDPHAIKVTQHNHPFTEQLGTVTEVVAEGLPEIDLLIGGSPCQGFSNEGKGLNFDDPRSKLFFEFVRLLADTLPRYFLLENVKMKKEHQDVISKYLGCEPIEFNSNRVSAQNRRRLYWTNIPVQGLPDSPDIDLRQVVTGMGTVLTREHKLIQIGKYTRGNHIYSGPDKILAQAVNGKRLEIHLDRQPPYAFYQTRTEEGKRNRRRIKQETGNDALPRNANNYQYSPRPDNKANCIVTKENPLDYIIDKSWRYRKLKIVELERLQTVDDGYTSQVSPTQARKLLGNGWTVDAVVPFFQNMKF